MDKADEEADQLDLKILTGGSADVSSSVCPLTGLDSLHLQPLDPLTPLAHQLLAAEPTTASSKEKRSSQTSKKRKNGCSAFLDRRRADPQRRLLVGASPFDAQ